VTFPSISANSESRPRAADSPTSFASRGKVRAGGAERAWCPVICAPAAFAVGGRIAGLAGIMHAQPPPPSLPVPTRRTITLPRLFAVAISACVDYDATAAGIREVLSAYAAGGWKANPVPAEGRWDFKSD